jgi:hypothetical protein
VHLIIQPLNCLNKFIVKIFKFNKFNGRFKYYRKIERFRNKAQRNRETERQRDRETERQRDREKEKGVKFFLNHNAKNSLLLLPVHISKLMLL